MATDSEVQLTPQQHSDLSSIAQSRSLAAGYVFRAKLILMLNEGASFNAIKRQLQTTAPTIIRWKQRFRRCGLEGLDTYHPGQKPRVLTPALRALILSATRRNPAMDPRTGVAASWPPRWASAKTPYIGFGNKPV